MKWTYSLFAFVVFAALALATLPEFSRLAASGTREGEERFLQTENWVISVKPLAKGKIYSVYSRNGHPLPAGLSDAQIADRYPDLYRGLHAPLSAYHSLVENAQEPRISAAALAR